MYPNVVRVSPGPGGAVSGGNVPTADDNCHSRAEWHNVHGEASMVTRIAKRRIAWSAAAVMISIFLLASFWLWSLSPRSPAMQWRWQARWFFHSAKYKAEVLAQAPEKNGALRHSEWDGWGWAGQDTTVYLVFDPDNSLAQAARVDRPGRYPGIPCEVPSVRRLASGWYTVRFYTNSDWNHCS